MVGAFTTTPLYYKATKEKYKDTEVLIEAGCHFAIVTKDNKGTIIVMDYAFVKAIVQDHVPPPPLALRLHAYAKRRYGSDVMIHRKRYDEIAKVSTDVHLL